MSFNGVLALRYVAGVVSAGASLDEAFRALLVEAPEPLRTQVVARLSKTEPGAGVRERAARLFHEPEFRLARAALMLAHEAGGPVAELLERCARQMEERRRWAERRRALAAQTVVSAWIVGCMPIALVLTLGFAAPDYLRPLLVTAPGQACLAVAAVLMSAGLWMVRRMVSDRD